MNDYACSKWVNELQVMNAPATLDTETVRACACSTLTGWETYSDYHSVMTTSIRVRRGS
jgi:dTDP-glucose 4,6-dehydratase